MLTIARQLSGHTDTSALRRAIAAYQFLEQLEKSNSALYAKLKDAPLSIVEVIARWAVFDSEGALVATERWAEGRGNVTTITRAMHEARPDGYAGKSGIALEKAYVAAAKPVVSALVHGLVGQDVKLSGTMVRDETTGHTLDFTFAYGSGGRQQIAVLVVGPYNNSKIYANRRADWISKAYSLALLHDRIVMALPDARAAEDYQGRVHSFQRKLEDRRRDAGPPGFNVSLPVVDVVYTDVPKLTLDEDRFIGELEGRHTFRST
jgi:hypothetical protein